MRVLISMIIVMGCVHGSKRKQVLSKDELMKRFYAFTKAWGYEKEFYKPMGHHEEVAKFEASLQKDFEEITSEQKDMYRKLVTDEYTGRFGMFHGVIVPRSRSRASSQANSSQGNSSQGDTSQDFSEQTAQDDQKASESSDEFDDVENPCVFCGSPAIDWCGREGTGEHMCATCMPTFWGTISGNGYKCSCNSTPFIEDKEGFTTLLNENGLQSHIAPFNALMARRNESAVAAAQSTGKTLPYVTFRCPRQVCSHKRQVALLDTPNLSPEERKVRKNSRKKLCQGGDELWKCEGCQWDIPRKYWIESDHCYVCQNVWEKNGGCGKMKCSICARNNIKAYWCNGCKRKLSTKKGQAQGIYKAPCGCKGSVIKREPWDKLKRAERNIFNPKKRASSTSPKRLTGGKKKARTVSTLAPPRSKPRRRTHSTGSRKKSKGTKKDISLEKARKSTTI